MADCGFVPPPPPGPPPRIPYGHRAVWSNEHEAFYYANTRTGATVWVPILVEERPRGEPQAGDGPQRGDDLDMSDRDAATSLRQDTALDETQANGRSYHDGHLHGDTEISHSDPAETPMQSQPEDMTVIGEAASQSTSTQHEDTEMSDSIEETTEGNEAAATRLDDPSACNTNPPVPTASANMGAESSSETDEVHDDSPPVAGFSRAPIHVDIDGVEEAPPVRSRDRGPECLAKQSIYVAEVGETAARVAASTADLDSSMLLTIQKMLSRANQAGANETEAQTALRMATKLMHRFNVTRAEVLAHDPEGQQQYTGQSLVNIRR